MYQKCIQLDKDIENLRREQRMVDDRLALTLIAVAIESLEAEKVSLHPSRKKP